MTDPAVLREQARELRRVATAVRDQGAALDDDLRTLRQRYPLPSPKLWEAPNADRYAEELTKAAEELVRIGRDADRYADDCEDEARRRDREADDLERAAAAG